MAAIDAIRKALQEVETDLAALDDRRAALERAAEGLRQALEALEGSTSSTRRSSGTRSKPATSEPATPKRPTITPDDLISAVRDLGGRATVEQLVEKLELADGRSLNGARRVAVDEERISYADRVYTLPSTDPRWPGDEQAEDSDAA